MTKNLRAVSYMALLAIGSLLTIAPVHAQSVYGSIFGTVTDKSGAVVPGATVTVTDQAKGTVETVISNDTGDYSVSHLVPDTYDIKVEVKGFETFVSKGIAVLADTSPRVDVALTIGGAGTTVTVDADTVPQLKTDRADVAQTYTASEIEELPIPDHNFANLQLLLPGAVQLGWAHAASENPQGSKQIQIDGQAFGGVNYTLDGTDNQDAILGIIVINPNSESMSEAKLATQNFDAEFGKAVASVETVQTKSGSNSFHGTLFDNRESNANLARDPFTVPAATGYPGGLKNQFGGSVGGPVFRNRIFFFGDYQGVRQKVGTPGLGTVPTITALETCTQPVGTGTGCDFSDYLGAPISNAANAPRAKQLYDNSSGTPVPYANNLIPLTDLSPQAVNLFKLLLANKDTPTNTALFNNFSGQGTGGFNSNQWDVRGDANIGEKLHIFGRFSRFTDTLTGASLFGTAGGPGLGIAGYGGVSQGSNASLALGADVSINPNLITDFRLGYFRYGIRTHKNDPTANNLPFYGENNLTGPLAVPVEYGTPDIQIADFTENNLNQGVSTVQNQGPQFGSGLNMNHCNCPLKEQEDQFQVVNNWTKVIRTHSVKFGVDLRYARNLRVPSDSDRTGVNNFGNGPTSDGTDGTTGLGFASFILGDVTSFNRYTSASLAETNAKEFQPRDFFYVQDTWRATQKLTVNIGARYELYLPERVNAKGNGALLNLQTGFINVAGEGGIPTDMGVSVAQNTWNPRVGIADQINPKTVIRAGYGRSFDLGVFGSTFGHVVTQNIPVLANQSLSGVGGNTSYAFNLSDPTNTAVPGVPGGKPANATSPLFGFVAPAIDAQGQIPINAIIPGTNPATTIGQSVSVKARPFTERLPTLDAWNLAVQRALTPTVTLEVAYVGNKGSHTLSDGDGNNTNPNEAAISLPSQFSATGSGLHYDPAGGNCVTGASAFVANCAALVAANPQFIPVPIGASGATSNQTLLQRYSAGTLSACNGPCNWTQGISYYGDDQDTHYNALQIVLTQGSWHGVSGSANYAYQIGTDNASGFATWDKAAVKGNDGAIRRSAFTSYALYHVPFGKSGNFLEKAVVGGWEISPIVIWQSGLPFSLSYGECSASNPGSAPCQPNGVASSLKTHVEGIPGQGVTYFNTLTNICQVSEQFSCPGLDTIGNVRRNTAWGPGFFNSDMSLMKNITIAEKYTAQFRMDAFNVFNHINLGNPGGNVDSSGGNTIGSGPYPTSTGGTTNPRQLQFTLHFAF
jgi:Carboxypeptidase regulatory-like domain/TonB dependent receptor